MALVGITTAIAVGVTVSWWYAPAAGWLAAALLYDIVVWSSITRMDAAATREHARDEDDGRHAIESLILVANVASLGAVLFVLAQADHGARLASGLLALACTSASWLLVHTAFTLHYARRYYTDPVGGISFNQDDAPDYLDFAYLAFSLGMTYQVSDTAIMQRSIRRVALLHSIVAFVFGMFVLATTINVVLGLAN